MKTLKIKFLFLCLLGMSRVFGQQDPQYSQYMFNGLLLNPGYTGTREVVSATMLGRYQWVGINGAPRTATFSIHGPTRNEKNAFGFSLYSDHLGVTAQTAFNFSYAYRLTIGPGILSMGLQGGIMRHTNNWTKTQTVDPDAGTPLNVTSAFLPLAGTGLFYYTNRFYLGASVPNLIQNKYKNPNSVSGDVAARQRRHYFITTGVVIPISEDLDFKPSMLVKLTDNAPVEFDFNAAVLFKKALWLGASYRTGDALVFMLEYNMHNNFRIGYAYDLTLTKLRSYNSGSHELMLGMDFGWNKSRIKTPRYF